MTWGKFNYIEFKESSLTSKKSYPTSIEQVQIKIWHCIAFCHVRGLKMKKFYIF